MATGMGTMAYRDQRRPPQGRPTSSNMRQNNYSRPNVHRRNGNTFNNYSNLSMENTQVSNDKVPPVSIYENEPMVAVIMSCLGVNANVNLKNGKHMNGILSGVSSQNNYMLNIPKFTNDDRETIDMNASVNLMEQTSLLWNDVVDVSIVMPYSEYQQYTMTGFATDSSISRANGASSSSEKELEAWVDDTNSDHFISLDDADGGWTAEDMIRTNERKFGVSSTYDSSLPQYTTAMPKFRSKEDQEHAEKMAEKHAKEIEMAAGYRQREELENNALIDEESKYSSVLRDQEFQTGPSRTSDMSARPRENDSTSQKYVPPGLRNRDIPAADPQGARGPTTEPQGARPRDTERGPALSTHPSQLPQREPKDRRSNVRQQQPPPLPSEEEGRVDRRWERSAAQVHGPHQAPPSNQPLHNLPNGERRIEIPNSRGFNPARSPQTMPPPQPPRFNSQPPPHHHPLALSGPVPHTQVSGPVPHTQVSGPVPHTQVPTNLPPPAARGVALPLAAGTPNGIEAEVQPVSRPPAVPPSATVVGAGGNVPTGADRRVTQRGTSAADKDRHVQNLRHFHDNFRVELPDDEKQEEKPALVPECGQGQEENKAVHPAHTPAAVVHSASVVTPQATGEGASTALPPPVGMQPGPEASLQSAAAKSPQCGTLDGQDLSSRSPQSGRSKSPKQQQPHSQNSSISEPGSSAQSPAPSLLNPLANDFVPGKLWSNFAPGSPQSPHMQQMGHQPLQQVVQPIPNQRASPGMTLVSPFHPAAVMPQHPQHPQHQQHPQHNQRQMQQVPPQPHSQTGRARKHAIVSVDNTAVPNVQQMTGQPLQLAAQAANMQQPYMTYHIQPPNHVLQQQNQYQIRVLQQGAAGLEHSASASGPNHQLQSYLMATQQPVPAHMPAQAMAQGMPQPTHTVHQAHHQHLAHQHGHPNMPPVSQTQASNPIPAASPVHMGPGSGAGPGPQINHTQGAPPQSGTPQPQLFGHAMQGMMPPGGGQHPMPAHGVAQGPVQHMQFAMQHHQIAGGVAFSQAGGNAGGPAPAHLQPSSLQSQQSQVVIMPQPPPHSINQPPLAHSHPQHPHPQHAAAAAQFQQQLQQGAVNQMHGVGPNHLLQGSMPGAGTMNMQQLFMHHQQQQNAMAGHHGHPHQLAHSVPHSLHSHHQHAHQHSLAHYPGQ